MKGILNGMVMQRNENNVCEIYVDKDVTTATYTGACQGVIEAEKTPFGTCLTGIPAGGPYTVDIDGESYKDIYVGDVWMLGGQSNMEGCGQLNAEDLKEKEDPEIRAYYMQGEWLPAKHPLCELALSTYKIHRDSYPPDYRKTDRCVGPGIVFAKEMRKYTGVPQGVIMAAHGGTSSVDWSPDIRDRGPDGSLYAAMVDRFVINGSNLRGMFWFQGCSDAFPQLSDGFTERTLKIFEQTRKDFHKNIPIVQVQIGIVHCNPNGHEVNWNSVRLQQYYLNEKIDNIDTISAIDKELTDHIHLASVSHVQIGKDAAESMAHLLWPERDDVLAAPRVKKVWAESAPEDHYSIFVEFENLHGSLTSKGRPWGFEVSTSADEVNEDAIFNIYFKDNIAVLRTETSLEDLQSRYLFYGGERCGYYNITDEKNRAIPAFGPIKIEGKK